MARESFPVTPTGLGLYLGSHIAAIAQLGERQTEDLKVPSSILGGGSAVVSNFFLNFDSDRRMAKNAKKLEKVLQNLLEIKKSTTPARFELTRAEPSRFRIYRLNHSAKVPVGCTFIIPAIDCQPAWPNG